MHWGKISRFSITVDHNDDIPIRTWALTVEPVLEPPLLLDEEVAWLKMRLLRVALERLLLSSIK